jgi:hypothetical protein
MMLDNMYNIYSQTDSPEIDMYKHFLHWLEFLESSLGRPLEGDEYIFPFVAPNGIIHPKKPMNNEHVQKYITDFAKKAGLTGQYTTHSPRRGGSQYRFMYAPIGKRWSLARIRWWGGWAIGEHVSLSHEVVIVSNVS